MMDDFWSTVAVAVIAIAVIILALVFYLAAALYAKIPGRSIGILGMDVSFGESDPNLYNIAHIYSNLETDGESTATYAARAIVSGTFPANVVAHIREIVDVYESYYKGVLTPYADILIAFNTGANKQVVVISFLDADYIGACAEGKGYCTLNAYTDGCGAGREKEAEQNECTDKFGRGFICCIDASSAATRCGPNDEGFCEKSVPSTGSAGTTEKGIRYEYSTVALCPPGRIRAIEYVVSDDYDKKCYVLNPSGIYEAGGAYCCMPAAQQHEDIFRRSISIPFFYRNNQQGNLIIEVGG
ncbi:MAG: hypothetical protein HZB66_00670 [Candidatus Aenigmarchaeota archaeon]|nr:hypothetical protein [Candidatus Aenigmarchaeota archaeon]